MPKSTRRRWSLVAVQYDVLTNRMRRRTLGRYWTRRAATQVGQVLARGNPGVRFVVKRIGA